MEPQAILRFVKNFNKYDSKIDSVTNWIHYRITVTILITCSILSKIYQHIGSISCDGSGLPRDMLHLYCWTENVYSEDKETKEETYHAWYLWVCLTLIAQAFAFYLPHCIWKKAEGEKIAKIINDIDAKDFFKTLGTHNGYVAKYVLCEILNFVNVVF